VVDPEKVYSVVDQLAEACVDAVAVAEPLLDFLEVLLADGIELV
jgi:hypothetical protein